ncbi:hypothetical protein ACH4OW_35535 [Streptomyces sp. NPDC017056]|uniref:hypothetical protein n=1 Tax=Streptomyces sp. NPDC017056 TaxID=3364973 RepID=UPI0037B52F6F
MSRRVSLPGADELFRTTGGSGLQSPAPRKTNGSAAANGGSPLHGEPPRVPAPGGEPEAEGVREAREAREPREVREGADGRTEGRTDGRPDGPESAGRGGRADREGGGESDAEPSKGASAGDAPAPQPARRRGRGANRRPSGRERHDEKITVYVSAEELMDLEHARLVLRGEHGLAVDRGRIVREAVAVVLADLESRGDASILVRRLRGR